MAIIRELRGFTPKFGKDCFLAENAAIIGDVTMGDDCSIWYGTVLRGDVNTIKIGDRVNIQDGAVVHTLYERSVSEIGNDVSVGHNAIIHGAKIGNNVLIGAGAKVLGSFKVGDNSVIAANSVVLHEVPENCTCVGAPARVKKINGQRVGDIDWAATPDLIGQEFARLQQEIEQLRCELEDLQGMRR